MKRILITGATGNVGSAVLRHLSNTTDKIIKGSYHEILKEDELYFNFDDLPRTSASLRQVDVLFLLRPPHISDTNKYFKPLITACKEHHVGHIVFLSVQGVEKSTIIPHNKIERLIIESGIPYTFVRPSYFMQNLTTTLKADIKRGEIFLPAGNAPFLWIDVDDIGRAIATILMNTQNHINKAYEITGNQYFTFGQVAEKLTMVLQKEVRYTSPNLLSFTFKKVREGTGLSYVFVLIMLHYLARFQERPNITHSYNELTGQVPCTLDEFIQRHRNEWI